MMQDGAEDLYTILLDEPVVNFGAAVWVSSENAIIDPWILGSADENDVQGQGGRRSTSTTSRSATRPTSARPRAVRAPEALLGLGRLGRSIFTGQALHGAYVLKSWINDVYPPLMQLVSARDRRTAADHRPRDRRTGSRTRIPASTRTRSRSATDARSLPRPATTP